MATMKMDRSAEILAAVFLVCTVLVAQGSTPTPANAQAAASVPVTVDNFIRAETDLYFARAVKDGGLGKLRHRRGVASIEKQDVVRMNRDTLYSSGVFDLDAAPLTIILPDSGRRFTSLQVISQDHYTVEVAYAPGTFTYTRQKVGTRYVYIIVRILADPGNPDDIRAANAVQDEIRIEQAQTGSFDVPRWDPVSQAKVRDALDVLATLRGSDIGNTFGAKDEVDAVAHLIGTAIGWGGNPKSAAVYIGVYPPKNDGKTVHKLTVRDVPVDGFWSVSIYNAKGYFVKNDLGAYSVNSLTATSDADGAFTIQFGGCRKGVPNCLPIMPGWNYTIRLYRPRQEIIDGSWKFPEARPGR